MSITPLNEATDLLHVFGLPGLGISSFLSGNIGIMTELVVALLDPVELLQSIHHFPLYPLELLQALTRTHTNAQTTTNIHSAISVLW